MDFLMCNYADRKSIEDFWKQLQEFRKYYPEATDTPEIAKIEFYTVRIPNNENATKNRELFKKFLARFSFHYGSGKVLGRKEFSEFLAFTKFKIPFMGDVSKVVFDGLEKAEFSNVDLNLYDEKKDIICPSQEQGVYLLGERPDCYEPKLTQQLVKTETLPDGTIKKTYSDGTSSFEAKE